MATTTQLGSVLGQITQCAGTASATVMGPGDDPHDFAASSQQIAQMAGAEVVFANGLGLEAGLEAALSNAEADGATIVEVAPSWSRCRSPPWTTMTTRGSRRRSTPSTLSTRTQRLTATMPGMIMAPWTRMSGWTPDGWPTPPS